MMYARNMEIHEYCGTVKDFILEYIPLDIEHEVFTLNSEDIDLNNISDYDNAIVIICNLENEKNSDLLPFLREMNKQNVLILICSKNVRRLKKVYAQEWKEFTNMLSYVKSDEESIFFGATRKVGVFNFVDFSQKYK